jgi:hypothetical protein
LEEVTSDILGDCGSLLLRYRRKARKHLSISIMGRCHVADDKYIPMFG